ncbi:MAG: sulfite exporter TauE/SafE family protein [Mariprofundaceae bacterium]|nr:sulfite exporter TauE/SafE family protein [Mariprofundaceae bacterium]
MEWDISLLVYGLTVGLCAGALAGFMAGLAGVGGGLIYVPTFYLLMPNSDSDMALAIFVSMVAIAITAGFSVRSHWQLGHVDVRLCHYLWPTLLLGASFGLWSTLLLPEIWILLALAALNAWVAYDYGRVLEGKNQHKGMLAVLGLPIGCISGVLGIAGGTMVVPLLRRFLVLKNAVGTSAMCGFIMVTFAVFLNLLGESGWWKLLQGQWPFLLATWMGILVTMPFSARKSAGWHDKLQERHLRMLLKCIFSFIAMMFCVIAWLK